MSDDLPDLGISQLAQAALGLHELYTELQAGGFSAEEAMHLVAAVLTGRHTEDDR